MSVMDVSDQNFEQEVLKADQPTLVQFWAPWCGPCRQLSPIIEDIAHDHGSEMKFTRVNVDENQAAAMQHQITSIPAMKVFVDGKVAKSILGAKPRAALESDLSEYL